MKRCFDLFMVLVTSPLWASLLSAVIIVSKIADPKGKIFFIQKRLGKNGKLFSCYKIRSMFSKDGILEEYFNNNKDELEYYQKYRKLRFDPRITKLGRVLRKTSLDELPQLFNVILGDMSLVGPRPYIPSEVTNIDKEIMQAILSVRPGITGLWQISGRSSLSFEKRVKLDMQYIKNRNFWFDVKIFFITFYVVLVQKGSV
ncbi:sugar transferase [Campylobacter sp. 19-13652]|uniref:sugar transferase n=1 Tax=Campylobacter sp. 19-13652 TaxID=2840180 RepID=UPI001C796980|nr:sugar transferase [Campylobacter sp. 19-13652]BCX79813.1 exopolysaccharide biosynthesis protein [Campylobacter sp. 19-13652]